MRWTGDVMAHGQDELDELIPTMFEVYRRTKEIRRRTSVTAIAKALELAEMHLHHALWEAGADVDLNPERDS